MLVHDLQYSEMLRTRPGSLQLGKKKIAPQCETCIRHVGPSVRHLWDTREGGGTDIWQELCCKWLNPS